MSARGALLARSPPRSRLTIRADRGVEVINPWNTPRPLRSPWGCHCSIYEWCLGLDRSHGCGPFTSPADQARALLKALGDPLRLQVIQSLAGGERCVCDLVTDLGLAQSKLSFHLKGLKQAGLLGHCGTPAKACP